MDEIGGVVRRKGEGQEAVPDPALGSVALHVSKCCLYHLRK